MSKQSDLPITRQEVWQFQGIVCHVFSPDGKYCAVSLKNDHKIDIYLVVDIKDIETWKLVISLSDQSQAISSVDWSINTQILSCSYDRSVIIWKPENSKWVKDLVICNNKRGVLVGKWSKNGKKFAIGTGDHYFFIGHFEPQNKWWSTRQVGSFKSSVICTDFHPSGRIVAAGSTDYSVKFITCYIDIEGIQAEDGNYKGPFDDIKSFNETIFTVGNAGSWVTSVAFSKTGLKFAYCIHSANISYGNIQLVKGDDQKESYQFIEKEKPLELPTLPLRDITFSADDKKIIGGGYDRYPIIMEYNAQEQLTYKELLKTPLNAKQVAQTSKMDDLRNVYNQSKIQSSATVINEPHSAPIQTIQSYPAKEGYIFTTSDSMGSIQFWQV